MELSFRGLCRWLLINVNPVHVIQYKAGKRRPTIKTSRQSDQSSKEETMEKLSRTCTQEVVCVGSARHFEQSSVCMLCSVRLLLERFFFFERQCPACLVQRCPACCYKMLASSFTTRKSVPASVCECTEALY